MSEYDLKKQLESLVFCEVLDFDQIASVHAQWWSAKQERVQRDMQLQAEYQAKQQAERDRRKARNQHLQQLNLSKPELMALAQLTGPSSRYTKAWLIEEIASRCMSLPELTEKND